MTLHPGPCPDCGGPPVPVLPWLTTRACPAGIAVIAAGVTAAHASAFEADGLGRELIARAVAELLPGERLPGDVAA